MLVRFYRASAAGGAAVDRDVASLPALDHYRWSDAVAVRQMSLAAVEAL